ncbi:MAG: shikimate kinase [Candidatus Omnitrophota bacterium]
MKNVYLVGFMGTGKTTVGKILAKTLKKEFLEMDETIEKENSKKITEIFKMHGEPYFRGLEKKLLRKISKKKNLIVSCGGGLICDTGNLETLKKSGTIFNLTASKESIYERTKKYKNRPLLNVVNPMKRIEKLMNLRMCYYSKAHYTIDTNGAEPEAVAEKIISILDGKK